jgi:hypothetical protein
MIFTLVINFLGANWQPKHITVSLFEVIDTRGQILDKNLTKLDIYELRRKIVAYVKDEGYNLNIMTTTLKSIINCDVLGLEESFQRTCFGHAFSKACSYATIDENFCKGLRYVSINATQGDL